MVKRIPPRPTRQQIDAWLPTMPPAVQHRIVCPHCKTRVVLNLFTRSERGAKVQVTCGCGTTTLEATP